MLDETIITETPPLYCGYGRIGQPVCVPITGNRSKRIIHGALNVHSGDLLLRITEVWDEVTSQYFLEMVRRHWRGWHIIVFEDRGSPRTSEESVEVAAHLGIEIRLLPRAGPKLNAMDHLFRFVKGRAVSNRQAKSIDDAAMAACQYMYSLSRHERLIKAGVLSGNFWLTS